jgi:hypothetical protein
MKRISSILILSALTTTVAGAQSTWNDLTFSMSITDAIAALKARNLKVIDKATSLDVYGDMGAADGSAKLLFSAPRYRLEKIVLTFDYGLVHHDSLNPQAEDARCRAEIPTVSGEEAVRRAGSAAKVARKYLERYGQPFFANGDRFPISGQDATWWELDIIRHEPWIAGVTWKWQEAGQQVKFEGYLLCRGGNITVEYSPIDRRF